MKFKFKIFTSFFLSLTFFVASVSGIVLYFTPRGRIAHWINWTFMGLSKSDWEAIHILFVTAFMIAGIFHLFYFNWKQFFHYFKSKASSSIRFQKELISAFVLSFILIISATAGMQPLYSLINMGEMIKDSYEISENKPPIPHAEAMTVEEFAAKVLNRPVERVIAKLNRIGYADASKNMILEDIANELEISPSELMEKLIKRDGQGSGKNRSGKGQGKNRNR